MSHSAHRVVCRILKLRQDLPQNVYCEMRCVHGGVWQSSKRLNQLLSLDSSSLDQSLALDHFGEARSSRNRGHAAARPEPYLGNVTIGHLDGKGHHVAADGMLKPGFGIGIREFAHVSGMLKMVEDLWRVTQCGRAFQLPIL